MPPWKKKASKPAWMTSLAEENDEKQGTFVGTATATKSGRQNRTAPAHADSLSALDIGTAPAAGTTLSAFAGATVSSQLSVPRSQETAAALARTQVELHSGPAVDVVPQRNHTSLTETVEFVKGLGIDPVEDEAILWIAEDALHAPLPPSWSEHMDADGRVYYHNSATSESSWKHPMDSVFREIVEYYRRVVSIGGFWEVEDSLIAIEREIKREIDDWVDLFDEEGEKFYYNRQSDETQYIDPRLALYHSLYARIKMVAKMKEQLPELAVEPRPKLPTPEELELARQKEEAQAAFEAQIIKVQTRVRIKKARKTLELLKAQATIQKGSQPLRNQMRLQINKISPVEKEVVLRQLTPHRMQKAASKMQARWRAKMVQKQLRSLIVHRAFQSRAATKVQAMMRMVLAKRLAKRMKQQRRDRAATIIQKCARGRRARNYVRGFRAQKVEFDKLIACVLRIQGGAKMRRERREAKRKLYWRYTSNTEVIQRAGAVYLARRKLEKLRWLEEPVQIKFALTEDEEARCIVPWSFQLWAAPWAGRLYGARKQEEQGEYVDLFSKQGLENWEMIAAMRLQLVVRGLLTRRRIKKAKQMSEMGINMVMDSTWVLVQKRRKAAVHIQKFARGFLCRGQDHIARLGIEHLQRCVPTITLVQAMMQRQKVQERLCRPIQEARNVAASVCIQAHWRGLLARRYVSLMKEELVWTLKSWFGYTAYAADVVRVEVKFVRNPAFDDWKYFSEFGPSGGMTVKEKLEEIGEGTEEPQESEESGEEESDDPETSSSTGSGPMGIPEPEDSGFNRFQQNIESSEEESSDERTPLVSPTVGSLAHAFLMEAPKKYRDKNEPEPEEPEPPQEEQTKKKKKKKKDEEEEEDPDAPPPLKWPTADATKNQPAEAGVEIDTTENDPNMQPDGTPRDADNGNSDEEPENALENQKHIGDEAEEPTADKPGSVHGDAGPSDQEQTDGDLVEDTIDAGTRIGGVDAVVNSSAATSPKRGGRRSPNRSFANKKSMKLGIDDLTEPERLSILQELKQAKIELKQILADKARRQQIQQQREDSKISRAKLAQLQAIEAIEEDRQRQKVKGLRSWLKRKDEESIARRLKHKEMVRKIMEEESRKSQALQQMEIDKLEQRERRVRVSERNQGKVDAYISMSRAMAARIAGRKKNSGTSEWPGGGAGGGGLHAVRSLPGFYTPPGVDMSPMQSRMVLGRGFEGSPGADAHQILPNIVPVKGAGGIPDFGSMGGSAHSSSMPNLLPGALQGRLDARVMSPMTQAGPLAPFDNAPPKRVIHRHIHHHMHYHDGEEEEAPMSSPGASPSPSIYHKSPPEYLEDQQALESLSVARVRSQFRTASHGFPSGTTSPQRQRNPHTSMGRTLPSFESGALPQLQLLEEGKRRGIASYARSVDRAICSYADTGRPRYNRGVMSAAVT